MITWLVPHFIEVNRSEEARGGDQIYHWTFIRNTGPGCCHSVDSVPACEPNGSWFNSQSGHMPGLQARSPVEGTQEATTHGCFSPSLSPFFSLSLKIKNKILKKINILREVKRALWTSRLIWQLGGHWWPLREWFIEEARAEAKFQGFEERYFFPISLTK